jgi:tetratricopeptide (TPR) repeat protein
VNLRIFRKENEMVKKRITICLMCVVLSFALCEAAEVEQSKKADVEEDSAAMKAFELRMTGKADEAKSLLEKAPAENPKDAVAHYEFARTKFHMALGNPGNMEMDLTDVQQSIEKAVENDPDNVIYQLFAGHVGFFQAYLQRMTGNESAAKEHMARTREYFESALKLKPDYYQVMVYLVEINSMDGKRKEAIEYEKQLAKMMEIPDAKPEAKVYHAKARSILFPDQCGVDFWKNTVLKDCPGNPDVFEELGKAYLGEEKVDDAVKCFEQAVEVDPDKTYLFLDLSIYHTFRGMKAGNNKELRQTSIKSGDAAVKKYIESEPIQPMLAYALGVRAKYKFFSDDKEQGQALFKQAEALDPYFSKATGSPHPDLFLPPGEVSQKHRYLARPF